MAYATADDVQTVLGRELAPEEVPMVERRLQQVERMILRRIPDLAEKISTDEIDQADVVDIEAEAVLRLVRNPDGYASESDGTYTYRFDQAAAPGKLLILPEEWQTLGIEPSRMFSIAPNLVAPAGPVPFYQGG